MSVHRDQLWPKCLLPLPSGHWHCLMTGNCKSFYFRVACTTERLSSWRWWPTRRRCRNLRTFPCSSLRRTRSVTRWNSPCRKCPARRTCWVTSSTWPSTCTRTTCTCCPARNTCSSRYVRRCHVLVKVCTQVSRARQDMHVGSFVHYCGQRSSLLWIFPMYMLRERAR